MEIRTWRVDQIRKSIPLQLPTLASMYAPKEGRKKGNYGLISQTTNTMVRLFELKFQLIGRRNINTLISHCAFLSTWYLCNPNLEESKCKSCLRARHLPLVSMDCSKRSTVRDRQLEGCWWDYSELWFASSLLSNALNLCRFLAHFSFLLRLDKDLFDESLHSSSHIRSLLLSCSPVDNALVV